jgi:pentatricopeptide repeat protein
VASALLVAVIAATGQSNVLCASAFQSQALPRRTIGREMIITSTSSIARWQTSSSRLNSVADKTGKQRRHGGAASKNQSLRNIEREIVQLGRSGETDAALSLYESVWVGYANRSGLRPTTRLMNAAIDACARSRPTRTETAFRILEEAMEGGVVGDAAKLRPNVYTAGGLMSCYARSRDAEGALKLLREMDDKYGVKPNHVVYATAISACERSQPPKADVALELLREATADPQIEMGVVGYNTAISALARVGDWQRAVQLLDEMEEVTHYGDISERYTGDKSSDRASNTARLLDPNSLNTPAPDEITFGTVMAACERAGQWRQALRVADRISAKARFDPSFAMDGLTITSAMHACQQLGLADDAMRYLDMMKKLSESESQKSATQRRTNGRASKYARKPLRGPDEVTYRLAISACSRSKPESRWADGIRLLREMQSVTGSMPDVVAYTSCIAGCAEAGEWGTAFQLLDEMKKKKVEPNVVTLSAVISSCATACANAAKENDTVEARDGYIYPNEAWVGPKEKALSLLRTMTAGESKIKPNVITYNAAIRACAEAFDMDQAFALFEDLKDQGLEPSVVTYGSLMTACERVGNLEAASKVIRTMRKEDGHVKPNEVVFGAAISCCRKAGEGDRAYLLLRKMIKEGLTPNTATFNTALMAQFEGKVDLQAAVSIYKLMQPKYSPRAQPNRQTFNIFVRGLAENARPNEAEMFLRKMQLVGFVPDVDLFTALVSSYERSGQPGKALQLMESMERDGYNFYEVKVLDDAFKKAVKFASAVERGLRPSKGKKQGDGMGGDGGLLFELSEDGSIDSGDADIDPMMSTVRQ